MRNTIFIFILAFTIPFIGCRTSEKEKLIGSWRQIPFTDPADTIKTRYINTWVFTGGDELVIKVFDIQDEDSIEVKYTYSIDGDKLRMFDGDVWFNGEYWVDVLDKKYLKMTKKKDGSGEAAWLRYEFVKE